MLLISGEFLLFDSRVERVNLRSEALNPELHLQVKSMLNERRLGFNLHPIAVVWLKC